MEGYIHKDSVNGGRWLVAIHGGGWRDPNYTFKNGIAAADALKPYFSGTASIEYRLSPNVQHPAHRNDCVEAVLKLQAQYCIESIVFIGHSAGAFLAGQVTSQLLKTRGTTLKVDLIVGVNGIYDLFDLVEEYENYTEMIEDAFTASRAVWEEATPLWSEIRCPIVAIQSRDDELLSFKQSETRVAASPNSQSHVIAVQGLDHYKTFEAGGLLVESLSGDFKTLGLIP